MPFFQHVRKLSSVSNCPNSRVGMLLSVHAIAADMVWVGGGNIFLAPEDTGGSFAAVRTGGSWTPYNLGASGTPPVAAIRASSVSNIWAAACPYPDLGSSIDATPGRTMWHWVSGAWSYTGDLAGAALTLIADNFPDPEGWSFYTNTASVADGVLYALHHADGGSTWPEALPSVPYYATMRIPKGAFSRGGGEVWECGQSVDPSNGTNAVYIERVIGTSVGGSYFPAAGGAFDESANAICPIGTTNVYAAGATSLGPSVIQATAWKYAGSGWSVLPHPVIPGSVQGSVFRGISGVADNDIWAVGQYTVDDGSDFGQNWPLLAHWDGSAWTLYPADRPYQQERGEDDIISPRLNAVHMRTSTDGWAVGVACGQMLVMHWDGTAWTTVELR